jgi:caffeoyl-CoA O-methyltransferase
VESKDIEHGQKLHAYVEERAFGRDDTLRRVEDETSALGGIAIMQTGAAQAALLELLVKVSGAKRALEVGTFTGYGAIRIARGLPEEGTLLCLELDEAWAATAQANVESTEVADKVEIRVGPALAALQAMPAEPTFDFAYLDADKDQYPEYYEEIVPRLTQGGLLGIDNVLKGGRVIAPDDDAARAVARLNDRVADDVRVESVLLPLADGLTLVRRK